MHCYKGPLMGVETVVGGVQGGGWGRQSRLLASLFSCSHGVMGSGVDSVSGSGRVHCGGP
jgi:hypothetical protein